MRVMIGTALLLALAAPSPAATLVVPIDFASIQEAIDHAVDGDTVLVKPGTYLENIDYSGKAINLMSEGGPEVTVVDGGQMGSVVVIGNGEGTGTVLDGFTITNGIGTVPPGNYYRVGGGIYCFNEPFPVIKNNIITSNTARYGGGICTEWSIEIRDNLITGNMVTGDGGGIFSLNAGAVTITNNQITDNHSNHAGGGIELYFGSYGVIRNNLIANNQSGYGGGGGIRVLEWSAFHLENNIIAGNQTSNMGGGIYVFSRGEALIVNNTLTGNSAQGGGGIACRELSAAEVRNTILWDNTAQNNGPEILVGNQYLPSQCAISGSDVMGGLDSVHVSNNSVLEWGEGMINEDPLFKGGGDGHLTRRSPCINRGSAQSAPSEDIDGDERPCMGSVDMGADEFAGTHTLEVDAFEIPSSGTSLHFYLDAQQENGNRNYLLAGGISGCTPGTLLPGASTILPVNLDVFSYSILFPNLNTVIFQDFLGFLATDGTGSATLNCGPLPFGYAGLTLHFAYGLGFPWDFASNPVEIMIIDS